MKLNKKVLTFLSISYIYIPIILFLLGWIKIYFALVVIAAIMYCFVKAIFFTSYNNDDEIYIDKSVIVFATLFFAWLGYYAGWGRFVDQASDWMKHNAVLYDLVNKGWPVIYENDGELSLLTYYIAQYIVPAFCGKIFNSIRLAEVVMYLWNVVGLILVFLNIVVFVKANNYLEQFIVTILLPFFSIPLWLAEVILKRASLFNQIGSERWFYSVDGIMMQYSSNFVLLRWVTPQTIPIWLIVIMLLLNKDKMSYFAFYLIPSILFGTLTFIGIIPLAIGIVLENIIASKEIRKCCHDIFSLENIIIILSEGFIFIGYFWGNVMSDKESALGFERMPYTANTYILYFVFVGIAIMPYAIALWDGYKRDGAYLFGILSLIVLPLFKMGMYNDLMMRSSIPALFVLMVYILSYLNDSIKHNCNRKIQVMAIICLMLIGMYYPFGEMSESVRTEDYAALGNSFAWNSLEVLANRNLDEDLDLKYNYYSYDLDKNVFYQYMMPH